MGLRHLKGIQREMEIQEFLSNASENLTVWSLCQVVPFWFLWNWAVVKTFPVSPVDIFAAFGLCALVNLFALVKR